MDLSDLALESHDSAAAGRYADQALRIAAGPGAARPQGASFERIARRAEAVLAQLKK
jgi:hypothetical protein